MPGAAGDIQFMGFDFLSGINMLGSGVLGIVVPFLFVLTRVVFFHELGHFLVAYWCMSFGRPSTSPRVDAVQPGSAAEVAGFKPGDLVLTINGRAIESFPDMQQIVSTSAGETLVFEVERGGVHVTLTATPALKE